MKETELLQKQLAFWKSQTIGLIKALDDTEKQANLYAELLDKTEEELNAERVKSEWISVDERLPESPSEILVSCCDGVRMMLYEGNNRWWYDPNYMGTAEGYEITHWMPLPEPPKMKGGAE